MGLNKIIGIVVAVIVIGAAAYFILPGFKAKVDSTVDKHFGWTPEARKKDPVGFIEYSMKRLDENIIKFETARTELRTASGKLEDLKRQNGEKVAFAEKMLGEFKAAYKKAVESSTWPASVAGRAYSEADLKSQVTLLLSQKTGYQNVLAQADTGLKVAEKRMMELLNRIQESKSKRSILDAQKALVQVNQISVDTEKLLGDVNDVIVENEAALEKPAVASLEDLMKEAKDNTAVTNPDTEKFLTE